MNYDINCFLNDLESFLKQKLELPSDEHTKESIQALLNNIKEARDESS